MVNKIKYLKEEEKEKKPLKDYILFQLVNLDVCTIGNLVTIQFLMLSQPKKKLVYEKKGLSDSFLHF